MIDLEKLFFEIAVAINEPKKRNNRLKNTPFREKSISLGAKYQKLLFLITAIKGLLINNVNLVILKKSKIILLRNE
jgi:hypothetical protein